MAKQVKYTYKVKDGCEGMKYMGAFIKLLGDCTQKELNTIYDQGNNYVTRSESK